MGFTLLHVNYDIVFLANGSVNLSGLSAVSVFSVQLRTE